MLNLADHIGDPAQEADMLAPVPITRVDDITAPVLLVHGANDVRVHRGNADRIATALRARGAEVEYLLNEREGHWFVNPDSNVELYRTLERFLARHLGGRTTTVLAQAGGHPLSATSATSRSSS